MAHAGSASGESWGGRSVAHRIAEAQDRIRLVAKGTITATLVVSLGASYAYRCELDDGTGQVGLMFLDAQRFPAW